MRATNNQFLADVGAVREQPLRDSEDEFPYRFEDDSS
jgi:hypothetical protein